MAPHAINATLPKDYEDYEFIDDQPKKKKKPNSKLCIRQSEQWLPLVGKMGEGRICFLYILRTV